MKCLSVCQPWAALIAFGIKRIENRTWGTKYRGPLAIQCSFEELLKSHRGKVVAVVDLVQVLDNPLELKLGAIEEPSGFWYDQRRFIEGPKLFVLSNAKLLEGVVRVRGMLGLFDLDPMSERYVREACKSDMPI